jgi:Fe-S-cluster-containing dehydrogenase component
MKEVLVADPEKCYGCLTCVLQCAFNKSGRTSRSPLCAETLDEARLDVECVHRLAVPVVCQQCEDAPCATVCPTQAIGRRAPDGPLLLSQDKCIGCRSCVLACPFGMVWMNTAGKLAQKCDLCADRTAAGLLPACVASCPGGALSLRPVDDLREAALRRHAEAVLRTRTVSDPGSR